MKDVHSKEARSFNMSQIRAKNTQPEIFLRMRNDFKKNIMDIAWETVVWTADNPDHLVHFDGEKFLGPYKAV